MGHDQGNRLPRSQALHKKIGPAWEPDLEIVIC